MTALITVCRTARLTPAAYRFYCAILRTFPTYGRPPDPAQVSQLAKRFAVPLATTLADCAAQDLLQLDAATGRIRAAYPFSSVPTVHQVTLVPGPVGRRDEPTGQHVFAMCALDALGIPLMLRRTAIIVSQDPLTHERVEVTIAPVHNAPVHNAPVHIAPVHNAPVHNASPATLAGWCARWDPPSAVVYARIAEHEHEHDGGCAAAGACCPITNFFADATHAQQWAQSHLVPDGVILAPGEALQRAHALFGGVLHRLDEGLQP
jgi:hypothetical protein